MRILHLTDRLSQRGGADLHLLELLGELAQGHTLHLCVAQDDGTAAAPCPVSRVGGLGSRGAEPCAAALDEVVRGFAPDLIHVHTIQNPSALAWAAERGGVATVQDHRPFCPGRGKLTASGGRCAVAMSDEACGDCFSDVAYYRGVLTLTKARLAALGRMRAITVLSSYMKRELIAVGIAAHRVHVVPPIVSDLGARRESPLPCGYVLVAGRLVAAKGLADAVTAWRRSGLSNPLRFVGTGSRRGEIEAQGFEGTGWCDHAGMGDVLRGAAALLFAPRWQEPLGIVGVEALRLGVPVAAWQSGGVCEWHPGPLGEWGDVDALARRLAASIHEPVPLPTLLGRRPAMQRLEAIYAAATTAA